MEADMKPEEDFEEIEKEDLKQAFDEPLDSGQVAEKDSDQRNGDSEFEDESACDGPSADDAADDEAIDRRKDETAAEEVAATLEAVIEAVLFASDESVTAARLAKIAETTTSQVRRCVDTLNDRYKAVGSAFRIEQIAGGYQMLTLPAFDHWLKKLVSIRGDSKLSNAALETLAIISYKQPVIRADIEAIRGVQCGEVIRSLMYKGLVKIVGRAEVLGRPMQYGTTKKFLEVFGLNSLKDLPKVEELKKPEQ
jgi:segregation and condensation protein B